MSPLRILVADDSLAVRVHLEQRLRQEGYVVSLASDGIEAVEVIRENPPDLAILDINMPRLDGYGVCQEILELKLTFPIVFFTSIRANAVRMLGDLHGAYLTKPVCGQTLMQTVRDMLAPAAN